MNTDSFPPLIGFLTVIDHSRFGLVGGFLVLNPVGRPVEFHCTAPVKATRAQEILFGNTLQPYLYGEQIAQVLIRRCKSKISMILTDVLAVLAVQDFIAEPLVFVPPVDEREEEPNSSHNEIDDREGEFHHGKAPSQKNFSEFSLSSRESAANQVENLLNFSAKQPQQKPPRFKPLKSIPGLSVVRWKENLVGKIPLWIPEDREMKPDAVVEQLKNYARSIHFTEPFSRIRSALEEAQKAA